MLDLPYPRLLTARLLGEPLSPSHERVMVEWWADPDFSRLVGGPRPRDETRLRLIQAIAEGEALQEPSRGRAWRMTWVLRLRESREWVGWVGLRQLWLAGGRACSEPCSLGEPSAEVFYALAPGVRQQGLATEAATAALREARRLGTLAGRTIGLALPQNLASRRVLEKLGFRANGTLMHAGIPHLLYECRERDRPPSGLTGKDQPLPTESLGRPIGLGMIGAGRYLHDFLAPGLRQQIEKGAVRPTGVVTLRQESASKAASSFGFQFAATGDEGITRLLNDPQTEAVVIATRHDTHAELAAAALRAGRHVLVEKPLALTEPGIEEVQSALAQTRRAQPRRRLQLLTGFNRRFAPLAGPLARALRGRSGPFQLSIVVNARPLPLGHWRSDRSQGGGRLLGHAVHFIDLARFLVDSPFERVEAEGLAGNPENLLIGMAFADGSRAVVHYCPTGDPRLLGEQVWVAGGGLTAWVNNWAALEIRADGETLSQSLPVPDKGFRAELDSFLEAVRNGAPTDVMRADEQFEVARHAIRAADGLKV